GLSRLGSRGSSPAGAGWRARRSTSTSLPRASVRCSAEPTAPSRPPPRAPLALNGRAGSVPNARMRSRLRSATPGHARGLPEGTSSETRRLLVAVAAQRVAPRFAAGGELGPLSFGACLHVDDAQPAEQEQQKLQGLRLHGDGFARPAELMPPFVQLELREAEEHARSRAPGRSPA